MKMSVKLALALVLLGGSVNARFTREKAFIEAVKQGDLEIVKRLFTAVIDTKTFDQALREAARNGDQVIFDIIYPFASERGRTKGADSLRRHSKPSRTSRALRRHARSARLMKAALAKHATCSASCDVDGVCKAA